MIEGKKAILIVDDFEEISEVMAQLLEADGYYVVTALNGKAAIKLLDADQFDMIITDILMPEMDGMELVGKAKELSPDVKVILMSGGGSRSSVDYDYLGVSQKLTGANAILKKPFSQDELIEKVRGEFSR